MNLQTLFGMRVLLTSPIPATVSVVLLLHKMLRTWPSENAYQLRRASAVITDRNDVAQRAPFVFSYFLEHID